jgi:hypothetical protein
MMQSIFAPGKMACSKSVNAVSASNVAFALVVFSIAQALGNARHINQAIVTVERIGGEAKDEITLCCSAADHRLANGQGQQAPRYAWRPTTICGHFIEINASHLFGQLLA